MVPLVPFDTVKSPIFGPRTPITGLRCSCAIVAADRSPSNVPVTVSLDPLSDAVIDPLPATVAAMVRSIGTGASLALNDLLPWAAAEPTARAVSSSAAAGILRVRMTTLLPERAAAGRDARRRPSLCGPASGNRNAGLAFRRRQSRKLGLRRMELVQTTRRVEFVLRDGLGDFVAV